MKKKAKAPLIIGGAIAGLGLAYAARSIIKRSEVAKEVHVETSIAINRSPAELYAFWRDFSNLPRFMKNLKSVTDLGNGRSHWVAKGINGGEVEWDAEIYNERENELIAWRSLENADVVNAGSVRFHPGSKGHGTYLRVTVNYNPPAGMLGKTILQILGSEPKQLIKEDLRRFKQLLETGEIATTIGQPSGRAVERDQNLMRPQSRSALAASAQD
jgi:uncharacterized membrane protein